MLVAASPAAAASEPLSSTNVKNPRLSVDGKGEAVVTYTTASGTLRHVLVWGAINARVPNPNLLQVRFKYDYSGGWKSHHNASYWKKITSCGRYDGPPLALVVQACKAPDGTYWALQLWQRGLPLLGFQPWTPAQSAYEVHNPTGTFCHSFVPQKPFPGYPSTAIRPAAPGDEYRFTIMGPGVTPVIQVILPGVEAWKGEPNQVSTQESQQRLWDAIMTGDKKCAPENGTL